MTVHAVPLKYLVGINERALPEDTDPDRQIRYVDISSVGRGELVAMPDEMRFADAPSRARRLVKPGDTIVSTVRTYLRAVWPVSGTTDDLVVSTGFAVLTPRSVNPAYFSWWVRSDVFIEEVVARSVGVSYPAINATELGEFPVRIPRASEQQAIVDFLDTETARIDALITKKQRLILLGCERLTALFDKLGWRPDEPEMRLNRLVRRFIDYRGATPEKCAGGIPLVTAGHIKNGRVDFALDPQFVSQGTYEGWMSRGFPDMGDVLMTMEAPLGEVAQVEDLPIALAQRVILMKPDERFITAGFLALLLRTPSFQSRLAAAATGSTALGIRSDRLRALALPVPSPSEQAAAVAQVSDASQQVLQLQARLEAQIRLLQEHRQAVITAAVTGEVELPEVAA